jgi:hypothetical protein
MTDIFPEEIFRKPLQSRVKNEDGTSAIKTKWNFSEEPLQKKLLEMESQGSESLRRALSTNLTRELIESLHYKATRRPPENINIEIKGQTRSGKSTVGIALGVLISKWWGHEFTADNILPNQAELLYRLKDAKYGETFLVDEQTPETFGEGILRETEQLGMNLNICAKRCNNLIFIYPPTFTSRNSPFGLEAVAKDSVNKYVKCFYYDLRRKEFGGAQIPRGYVILPKLVDPKYCDLPQSKWSERRLANFTERHFDYDSLLEENYEKRKDDWIDLVRNMDTSIRNVKKEEISEVLAHDEAFLRLRSNGQREAYIQLKINKGEIMDFAKTEISTISNMAVVIAEIGETEQRMGGDDGGVD